MKRLLASLWSYATLQGMAIVLLPLLLLSGHRASWAGLGYVSAVLPYVLFGLAAGRIGDRIDRKLLLALALALAFFAGIWLWLVLICHWSHLWLLLSGILLGTAQPFVDAAVFGALSTGVNRSRRLSFAIAAGPAGRVIGSLLVALTLWLGNGTAAASVMVIVACMALLFCCTIPRAIIPNMPAAATTRPWRELFSDRLLKQLIFSGVLWNLLAVMLAGGASAALLKLLLALDNHQTALVIGVAATAAFLASMLSPQISAHWGAYKTILFVVGASVGLSCLLMVSVALDLPTSFKVVVFILLLFANQIYITNLMVERQGLAPADSRSSVATASRLVTWLGASVGVGIYSWLIDIIGAQWVGWLVCMGALLVWLLMLFWWRENFTKNSLVRVNESR